MSKADNLSIPNADVSFPFEIFNSILENVIDRQTLANCALVNRTWGRRSQELLFRKVSLHTFRNQLQKLLRLLVDSPHIRLLIRELSIYSLSVKRRQPAEFDRHLAFVISCVTNLAHIYLQFKAIGYQSREDLPDFLTATVRPALRQLQHLQSVTFSDDDGYMAHNAVDMFRACDGLTVRKIVISDCEGVFLSSNHPPLIVYSRSPM